MKKALQELYKYRELLYMITYRDIKVRYKQSIMGFLWAILMPILIVMAGLVVRYAYAMAAHTPLKTDGCRQRGGEVASLGISGFQHQVCLCEPHQQQGTGDQDLFSEGDLSHGGGNGQPLRSLGGVRSADDLSGGNPGRLEPVSRLWTPVLLLTMVLLATGIGVIVSAASLFFRDVKFIVEVLLTFAIFFTPVFYEVGMFGDKGKWLLLNPAAPILDGFGASIARHQSPDLLGWRIASVLLLVALLGGYVFFKHLEPAFAESI